MTPFRKLTSAETAALEALGNSAEDWSKVLVSEDFKPFQLLQSHLEGDVEIAAEARIVRSRVANYRIGTGSLVEGVTALECRRRSAFGNGVGVATMNECGGRTVKIFDRLSAQVAYVMAVYRHRPQTIAALEKMVDAYAEERSSEIGEVGSDCRIVGARFIREVRIGNGVEIDGASILENATLCDGARVGVDVKAYDFIAAENARIDNGSIVERCFVGESCRLDKGFTAAESLFFANSHCENGEAASIFAGPYTVSHHKSSLLIAGMFSFFNAGSGTNQSNHAYKLGLRHHGVLERGCKTASGSHISWPAHIGAFSLVMGHCAPGTDSSEWPFSYLVEQGSSHYVIPGITLRGVGTLRDIGKWPARDGRLPQVPQTDRVSFEAFSPYTMGRVFRARITLEELSGRFDADTQEITWNGLRLKEKSVKQGIEWYRLALDRYLGEQLIRQLEAHEGMPSDGLCEVLHPRAACSDRWGDIGGMLAPISEINDITRIIATGQLDRIEKLRERLRLIHDRYDDFAWAWTWNLLHEIYPDSYGKDFIPSLCLPVIRKWETAATTLNRQIIADATKDISTGSLAGFGIDGGEETAVDDALAVRGTVQQCGIIQELEKQQTEIKEKAGYWLHKLTL